MKQKTLTITEAKRQIEELQKHIDNLKANPELIIRNSISELGLQRTMYNRDIVIERIDTSDNMGDYYIKLPLPNANVEWTIEAYEWMKKYILAYPNDITTDIRSYPVHEPKNDNTNYLYIKVYIKY
jgi:hypothetical protein